MTTCVRCDGPVGYVYEFPRPALTVDLVIFGRPHSTSHETHVLLIRRGKNPHAGMLALPGGFLNMGETAEAAAHRELEEETGLADFRFNGLVGVYDAVDRDARGRVISVAYCGEVDSLPSVEGRDDAVDAMWVPIFDALAEDLAFDHKAILQAAVRKFF